MATVPAVFLVVALVVLPLGCISNWWASGVQLSKGLPLVPYRNRDCVGWGLLDMGVYVMVLAAIAGLGVKMATARAGIDASDLSKLTPNEQSTVFLSFGCSVLLATALSIGWNWSRFQILDGFDAKQIGADIALGIRWFTMLIIPVVGIQLLLNQWFPTQHPLIEMMRESGDVSFLPIAAFAAVVSAPIFEECFFRLFFQGWLEKLQITRERTTLGLATKADREAVLLGGASSGSLSNEASENSDSTPNENKIDQPTHDAADSDEPHTFRKTMWTPILVTSAIFSLAHWGHGPDFVPLFFLAIGLGYLYQRTGSILPSIVVHICVNTLGVLQLWAAVTQK